MPGQDDSLGQWRSSGGQQPNFIGSHLGDRYQIEAEIGRGGMGVVFKALDPILDRHVAVKLIPPALMSPESEERFMREARIVARMEHPSIVSIYDFGRHEGMLFYVMPLLEGSTLRQCLRKRAMNLGEVVDTAIQVSRALEYSHSLGVIHRDIKPENIMLLPGSTVDVKVMDFGLALHAAENRMTKTEMLVGTMAYLSPEQVGGSEVDVRSDLYSLGAVIYEALSGNPPFLGEIQSILYRIVHEAPESLSTRGADVDEELDSLVLACLKKDPAQRPQSAGEVADALERYRGRIRDSERLKSVIRCGVRSDAQRFRCTADERSSAIHLAASAGPTTTITTAAT